MTQQLSSKDAAEQIGTTARELRVWLRTSSGKVHAQRNERDEYAFDPKAIPTMKSAFEAWTKKRDQDRAAARAARRSKEDSK